MTLSDEYALACYEQIAVLDEKHGITLVQHQQSKKIYVKKVLTVFNPSVYQYLNTHRIKGIPEIIEAVEDNNSLIVIEEYISGETISSFLDNGSLFSEKEAVAIIRQLCVIIRELHSAVPPIVHRDIKPSNIILTSCGDIYLIDMNAAKIHIGNQSKDTSLIGTNGYAAPEQYGFRASGCQADIFSIGILLNEMLVGKRPNEYTAPGWLGTVIRKCTMMDPKDRYASVDELIRELDQHSPAEHENGIRTFRYMIPGFRSMNPTNMIVAIMGYTLIFFLSTALPGQNTRTPLFILFEKIFFILTALLVVALTSNYLNIWHELKIDRIRNPILRAIVILLLDAVSALLMVVIMVIIESA